MAEIANAETLLHSLRWEPDQVVTNPFGERVWLREAFDGNRRIGITDCCFADDPCDWHSSLLAALERKAEAEGGEVRP